MVCVCVCVCVYGIHGYFRLVRNNMHHFLFFLIAQCQELNKLYLFTFQVYIFMSFNAGFNPNSLNGVSLLLLLQLVKKCADVFVFHVIKHFKVLQQFFLAFCLFLFCSVCL